jgi:error-prone DNA polymerase
MFTHLHCHSYYSFNAGTIPADVLPQLAKEAGMSAIALTDTNNLSGAIEFYSEALKCGVKPILGVELKNRSERAVLLAKNNNGYKEICDTVTGVLQAIPQVKPKLTLENLIEKPQASNEEENERSLTPFLSSLTEDTFILSSTPSILRALATQHREHLFIELIPAERKRWKFLREIFRDHRLSCIASNNVFLHKPEDHALHLLLRAIGTNTTLGNTPGYELADRSQTFSNELGLQKLFYDVDPRIFENNQRIAEQCEVSFTLEKNKFARYPHEDPKRLLRELTWEGLARKGKLQSSEYLSRVENELNIITTLNATSYFLAVYDMLQFARHKNFPFLGRGSGANSLVAYLLGIANVDPVVHNLRFERFLNPERESAPDFDIDFSWRDRYEVINYMLDKYGRENAAMLCTVQSYRNKGTVREVGKALGFTDAEINERISGDGLIRNTAGKGQAENKQVKQIEADTRLPDVSEWMDLAKKIYGFPRNLSVHAGGIVIGDKALSHYTPVQYAPIGVPITQFDMFSAEDLGLIKLDILSTRGLGTYWDTMNLVEKRYGVRPPVTDETVAFNDEPTKASIREGMTKGCFYIESPAMISLLKKLRTDTFENLTAASSVIRPGVSQSGMMQEFIRRHRGMTPAYHIHPLLGELMKDTYGVMVYQEDVLIVAHELAGLSYGEADLFRRAMSGKLRSHERMHQMQGKFVGGCVSRGVEQSVAEEVWRQVSSFAGYSFCKAHSASYAVLSFQEAWLKVHYPAEFICSVLNNFGGFYNHQEYIEEAKKLGITVRLPDVNKSAQLHTVEDDGSIRLGMVAFRDVKNASIENLLSNRETGHYTSIEDFAKRSGVTYEDGMILIQVGLCDSLCASRMEAALLFGLLTRPSLVGYGKKRLAGQSSFAFEEDHLSYDLPDYSSPSALTIFRREKQYLGYSVTNSPHEFIPYNDASITRSGSLQNYLGRTVTVIGYVSASKVTSTRKGERMLMLNISDADGMIDVVVWPDVFRRSYSTLSTSDMLTIRGKVSESFDVVTLEAISISEYVYAGTEVKISRRPRARTGTV